MANSHVGHDCHVGDDVTFANGAVLGGHVSIANHVFIGGNTAVHQFVRVGEGAMLGGMSGITRDIIPFGFAFGPKAVLVGLNMVGLKRRKFSRTDLHRIRDAYQMLFFGEDTFAERLQRTGAKFSDDPVIGKIVSFIREGGKRPPMMPASELEAAPIPTLRHERADAAAAERRDRARHHLRRRNPAVCAGRRRHPARPACRAVRTARMGGPATGCGLSASLDLDRAVRPFSADCRERRMPRRGLHRLGGAAFALEYTA